MGRTYGASDKKPRKKKGYLKRWAKYRRKHPKKKSDKFVPYVSKRNRNDPIKLFFKKQKPMSIDGIKRWNKNFKPNHQMGSSV